ncbi:MAG: gliding motility-associated C-terminal domain-containing protein [Saprospiraceae bacterium]
MSAKPIENTYDITLCDGEKYVMNNTEYSEAGIFTQTLLNSNYCDSVYYYLDLTFYPDDPIELTGDSGFCKGDNAKLFLNSGHSKLKLNGNDINSPFLINEGGDYTLSCVDKYGCNDTLDFNIVEFPAPQIDAVDINDVFYEEGKPLEVKYYGDIINYQWLPSFGLDCYDCPFPLITDKFIGKYSIMVENEFGCTSTAEININYKELEIYVPNVIANTAYNIKNQFFYLQSNVDVDYSLMVFDRWGELLFGNKNIISNDYAVGWNPGNIYNPGVYVWVIQYQFEGKIYTISGDVTLL